MLDHHCTIDTLYDTIRKERGFIRTMKNSPFTQQDVKNAIKGDYVPISNKQTLALAQEIIDQDKEAALAMVLGEKEPTALTYAIGQDLMRRLQQQGETGIESAIKIAEHLAEKATQQGQAIQALSMWNRLTPEGALAFATKVAKRNKTKLTPDKARRIRDKAGELRDVKNKNERDVKTGELMAEIQDLQKTSLGKKISTLQAMGQLLNPKTAIRNLLGNALFAASEIGSQSVAAAVDSAVSLITGKRTTVLPNVKAMLSGFQRGGKAGVRDALMGIDTSTQGGKFDLPKGKTFKNPILQKLEIAMNLELKATDRAFYEMAYRSSLLEQVQALKKSKGYTGRARITPEMKANAHLDALYKTFQDDSLASRLFTGIKRAFNLSPRFPSKKIGKWQGDFGLGDFILKYPKTPANLLSRAFAYSPAGYLKAMYEVAKPFIDKGSGVEFNQKEFVHSVSRATLGTMGIGAFGYTLGKLGLATGEYGSDKDIEAVKKLEGVGPYKINASGFLRYSLTLNPENAKPQQGDTWFTYDWAQPMAVPLAAGVNIAIKPSGDGKTLSIATQAAGSVFEGAETLTQQNVVKGIQDFFSVRDEEGKPNLIAGFQNVATNAPSSFIPTIFSQANQLFDNTARETYDPSLVNQSINKVKAKIPGAAQTLPIKYDVYGQPMERYQDKSNNLFNVMINPAFVSKLKADPVGQEVLNIYNMSGETKQAPRTVPKSIKITKDGTPTTMQLDGDQLSAYQKQAGEQTKAIFDQLEQMPEFSQLSDESKADVMSSVMTDVHTVAKVQLFGHEPKKMRNTTKILLRGNDRAYMGRLRLEVRKKYLEDRRAALRGQ